MGNDSRSCPAEDQHGVKHGARESAGLTGQETSVPKTQGEHSGNQVFDREEFVRRCGGDAGLAALIAAKFQLRSGRDAGDLEAAIGEGKIDSVIEIAHRLKGVAASLSAHRLAECYRTLEAKARAGDLSDPPELVRKLKTEMAMFNDALSSAVAAFVIR